MNNIDLSKITKPVESLIGIFKFLFFTLWGWIIVIFILFIVIIANSKNEKGYFSFLKFSSSFFEKGFFFFSNLFQFFAGLIIVWILISIQPLLKDIQEMVSLYKDIRNLEMALKNLKSERKLLEIIPVSFEDNEMVFKIKYFAYSPLKGEDIETGARECKIYGRKAYFDFIVLNFDYALIESGKSINIAIPYLVFSDTIPFENGVNILYEMEGIPLSLKLDEGDLFLLNELDYKSVIKKIMLAVKDKSFARKTGIRTYYSEAIGISPVLKKKYTIYSTGTGGILLK